MAKSKVTEWLSDEKLILLEGWARDGLTDEQLAKNMGISRSTLYDWKIKYSDISDALKRGKEVADYEVENALFKRACGYKYTEITKKLNPDTQCLETVSQVEKEMPPDTTAQIFWLKNRRPDKWRDKIIQQTVNEENDGTGVVLLPEVTATDE